MIVSEVIVTSCDCCALYYNVVYCYTRYYFLFD
ncbi:hypothetical protein bas19_0079 [Escherichia phage ChristophMerian]|nr:hypothetical protein bas19_0079 [Escherichia phage ChristophMerian]